MSYEQWRKDVFGKPSDAKPACVDLLNESISITEEKMLDYIDRALQDSQIHSLFSKEQIGIGLNLIYSNDCSDIPFSYVEDDEQLRNESRKITAIQNLKYLYLNYFERYCPNSLGKIDDCIADGRIGYICYMLWDVFVLYPGNATTAMVEAGINVMKDALYSENESCIVSAVHGLGHWVSSSDAAAPVLSEWLQSPSTKNKEIIDYAVQANTGHIL